MEEKFKLELGVIELNTILQALGKIPYEQSVNIIDKIRTDVQSQRTAVEESKEK